MRERLLGGGPKPLASLVDDAGVYQGHKGWSFAYLTPDSAAPLPLVFQQDPSSSQVHAAAADACIRESF